MMYGILFAAIIAFGVSAYLTKLFCNPASRLHLLDHPNERSLHTRPTPRSGGVAILLGFFLASVVCAFFVDMTGRGWLLIAGAALIAVLSFFDDRHSLSVSSRFLGHVFVAGLVVVGADFLFPASFAGMALLPGWFGLGLSLLFLVWMINLYNFMDGMDGFAGGMAVIGFGTFAVFGLMTGNLEFFALSLALCGAAIGFLLFNFPPARIFMGDTGSVPLGLLAGGLILWGAQEAVFPFWVGLLVFSPFIVDATTTLLRRLLRRDKFWLAHKTHYYQRLVLLGWGHRKTVLAEYVLMLVCACSAIWAATGSVSIQFALFLFWVLVYVFLAGMIPVLERRGTDRSQ